MEVLELAAAGRYHFHLRIIKIAGKTIISVHVRKHSYNNYSV